MSWQSMRSRNHLRKQRGFFRRNMNGIGRCLRPARRCYEKLKIAMLHPFHVHEFPCPAHRSTIENTYMTFAQALACQRDDLADSVVDLKIRISQIEKERHALHEAQSVDAVTIQALKESCEVMKSKLEQQEAADALLKEHIQRCLALNGIETSHEIFC